MELTQNEVKKIKELYVPGSRMLLLHMSDDPYPVSDGTKGTVETVDDAGQIHCAFDNGRHLAVVPGVDQYLLLPGVRTMTNADKLYAFSQSQDLDSRTGCIGHLRADMDTFGEGFFSSWTDHRSDLKTQEFKDEFDAIINAWRFDEALEGILKYRNSLADFCRKHPESLVEEDRNFFGFRADTEKYTYMVRLNPNKGEYNMYCYCYLRQWLDAHMKRAEYGIHFIDERYPNKFVAADGAKVRYILSNGDTRDMIVRFINEHHFEANADWGKTVYHISEFAEAFAKHNCKDIFQLSLPSQKSKS